MKTTSFLSLGRSSLLAALVLGPLGFGFSQGLLQAQDTPPAPDPAVEGTSADGIATAEYPASRYDKIRVKSPFEFELAKPKPEEAVDVFQDLVLAGYAGSANRVTVYLANTKTQERMTIPGDPSHNNTGFRVISVNRGAMLKTTTVTIEKGGVTKELGFDSKALSSMVASGGSAAGAAPGGAGARGPLPPGGGQPGQIPRPGGVVNAGARPVAYASPTPLAIGNRAGNVNPGANAQPNGNPGLPGGNLAGNMLNNGNNGQLPGGQPVQVQAASIPQPAGVVGSANNAALNQPRRRVVLPTQH